LALAAYSLRRIGGQTGDVLGALQQVAELAGWCALAALAA
jgi:adenosylcobinamide-GDP ribazoletransferase